MDVSFSQEARPLESTRLLDAVGLSADEERVYISLLDSPRRSAADVARGALLTPRATRRILGSLEAMGLASKSLGRVPLFVATPPQAAIELLILKRQEQLEKTRLAAAELQEHARRAAVRREPGEVAEIIAGPEPTNQRFEQLMIGAKREILVFDRPPYSRDYAIGTNRLELEALDRGVDVRVIYDPRSLEHPGVFPVIRECVEHGEVARTFSSVPVKLALFDRETGMIPLQIGRPLIEEVLVLHASALVDALAMLFEAVWMQSRPLRFADIESERASQPVALSSEEANIVALLGAGLKDRAIAARLGIAPRTLDRRIRSLMSNLGATNRFSAALVAVRRGWIPSPATDHEELQPGDVPHTGACA